MYHCNFSEQDKRTIKRDRFNETDPLVRKRMSILWYKSLGYPHYEIAQLNCASPNMVTATIQRYRQGGLEKIRERNFNQPESELQKHRTRLILHFRKHPPASLQQACSDIKELTGIERSPSSVRTFLLSIGMSRRKVGAIPSKADPEVQESYINNKLQPVLDEAKSGKRQVYFVDAAHFVLAPFLSFLWSFSRLFIKAPAGRQRFNVLGALNAVTHEIVTITNDTYINAQSVCSLLKLLAAQHGGTPVTLIMDNARYQKCSIVTELAKSLNIDLLYLPPYSPNLNLIERVWKFVKKEVLYSRYYPNYREFKQAISDCINNTHTKFAEQMESLLSLRFQRFQKSQIMGI